MYGTTINHCTCKLNKGQKQLLNYTRIRRKRLQNNLIVQRGALVLRGSKISIFCPSCSKIMLMIIMSWNNIENELSDLNAIKISYSYHN